MIYRLYLLLLQLPDKVDDEWLKTVGALKVLPPVSVSVVGKKFGGRSNILVFNG